MPLFDYSGVKSFEATLAIDDPGNCAIVAHGYYPVGKGIKFPGDYYMIIKTIMGQTTFLIWGAMTDMPELPHGFDLTVKSVKYKEATIAREISLFLNDGMHFIYEAVEISQDEAFEHLPQDYNFASTLEYVIDDEKAGKA